MRRPAIGSAPGPATGRGRARGFTLLELILSSSVSVGILAGAYLCLQAGLDARALVDSRLELVQNARAALARLAADLRAACPLSRDLEFVGMDRELDGREADNLDFATHNYAPRRPGEGDFCEVSYFVDRDRETGRLGLWRRRDPSPDQDPLSGGTREEIASGLRAFRIEYYDGFRWYDEWGDTSVDGSPPAGAEGGAGGAMRGPAGARGAGAAGAASRPAQGGGAEGAPPGADGPAAGGLFSSNLYGLPDAVRITLAFSDDPPPTRRGTREQAEEPRGQPPLVFQTVVHLNLAARGRSDSRVGGSAGASAGGGGASAPAAPSGGN